MRKRRSSTLQIFKLFPNKYVVCASRECSRRFNIGVSLYEARRILESIAMGEMLDTDWQYWKDRVPFDA